MHTAGYVLLADFWGNVAQCWKPTSVIPHTVIFISTTLTWISLVLLFPSSSEALVRFHIGVHLVHAVPKEQRRSL